MTAEFCISTATKNAFGQFLNLETNFIKHELSDTIQYSPELKQNKDSIYTERVLKTGDSFLAVHLQSAYLRTAYLHAAYLHAA